MGDQWSLTTLVRSGKNLVTQTRVANQPYQQYYYTIPTLSTLQVNDLSSEASVFEYSFMSSTKKAN